MCVNPGDIKMVLPPGQWE